MPRGRYELLTPTPQGLSVRPDVYGTAVTEVQITTCVPRVWTSPPPPPRGVHTSKSNESLYIHGPYDDRPDTAMESASHTRFEATCTSTPALQRDNACSSSREWFGSKFVAKLRNLDPVKLAYLRTSFVFAISILVTWTPSSINRVHNLIHPNDVSFGLNVASAVVLPLQGVWNAVIYFSTSWGVCKEEVGKTWAARRVIGWWREGRRGEVAVVERRGMRSEEEGLEMGSLRVGNVRAMRGSF